LLLETRYGIETPSFIVCSITVVGDEFDDDADDDDDVEDDNDDDDDYDDYNNDLI